MIWYRGEAVSPGMFLNWNSQDTILRKTQQIRSVLLRDGRRSGWDPSMRVLMRGGSEVPT